MCWASAGKHDNTPYVGSNSSYISVTRQRCTNVEEENEVERLCKCKTWAKLLHPFQRDQFTACCMTRQQAAGIVQASFHWNIDSSSIADLLSSFIGHLGVISLLLKLKDTSCLASELSFELIHLAPPASHKAVQLLPQLLAGLLQTPHFLLLKHSSQNNMRQFRCQLMMQKPVTKRSSCT